MARIKFLCYNDEVSRDNIQDNDDNNTFFVTAKLKI